MHTDTFEVRFPGQTAQNFNLSVSCPGGTSVRSCSVLGGTTKSIGDTPVTVPIQYTAGANNDTSSITLTATLSANSAVTTSGELEVVAASGVLLSVTDANPEMDLDRSACLNVSAGPGSIVCGDYQYVYPITPVNRMNRTHQLALIHNNSMRGPEGFIGANFVLPSGVTEPDSIKATLEVDGEHEQTLWYKSGVYEPGVKTRIAFNWSDWSQRGPKIFRYTVTLQPWSGGSAQAATTAEGRALTIDTHRRYNRAWWIAGLEKITLRGDSIHWIGPDASAAVYLKSGSKWIKQSRSAPDTIVQSGSNYIREALGGGEVHYSSYGFETKAVDRNGNETLFDYQAIGGWTRLTSVRAPTPTGNDTIYKLHYDAVGIPNGGGMVGVSVLDGSGGWDRFDIHARQYSNQGVNVDSIVAPDGTKVSFTWSHGRLETITDPTGVRASMTYQQGLKAYSVALDTGGVTTTTMTFRPAEVIGRNASGWKGPQSVHDGWFSRFDGPLSGSADTTAFYTEGFGAVRGVRDALGRETWIDREDPDFPGLETRVRYPNGHVVESAYTSEGFLDYTLDRSTGGLTDYRWKESVNRPDTIVSPEGVTTVFAYDSNGNMLSQRVGTGGITNFWYNSDGQVHRIYDGLSQRDSLVYDSDGNLSEHWSPQNNKTTYTRDALGRVTVKISPVDLTYRMWDSVTYDVMGRVTRTKKSSDLDGHWLIANTAYDAFGRQDSVWSVSGDGTSTWTLGASRWTYDALSRVTTEVTAGVKDSLVYDLAGRVIERINDRGQKIETVYDILGRPDTVFVPSAPKPSFSTTIRTIPYYSIGNSAPADTITYEYEPDSDLPTDIDNRWARVTRTYTLDGQLNSEQQAIKNYNSGSFSTHVYDLSYVYDRDRRRIQLTHPTWLSPGTDQTTYSYDVQGRISSITGPLGDTYGYTYNLNDQVTKRTFPGAGGGTMWAYDSEGRVTRHVVSVGVASDSTLDVSMTYQKNGLLKSTGQQGGGSFFYTGLGQLHTSLSPAWQGPLTHERFTVNGFGHQLYRSNVPDAPGDSTRFENTYDPVSGRITDTDEVWARSYPSTPPSGWSNDNGWNYYFYDDDGNRYYSWQERSQWDIPAQNPPQGDLEVTFREEAGSIYSADNKLMFHQVNRDSIDYTHIASGEIEGDWGVFEEYWYDGLGRRILKRSRQDSPICTVTDRCYSSIERFVWDGEQILWELRLSGSSDIKNPSPSSYTGEIGYVHGAGIDAPLGMMRNGTAHMMHSTNRGLYAFSTNSSGGFTTCVPNNHIGCDYFPWPGGSFSAYRQENDAKTHSWYGSLALDQRDETGMSYRRNRYYDPESGQFTAVDPIGIAGGLNTYGFAAGDPINFSDPMGLAPWCIPCLVVAFELASAAYDVYQTTKAFDRSSAEGFESLHATAVGSLAPGPGHLYLKASRALDKISLTADGVFHVARRHMPGGSEVTPAKSVFNAGEDVLGLILDAAGTPRSAQAVGNNYVRTIDAGRAIGTDAATGNPTSIYSVITDADDNLVTAFPGVPGRK
ncbi:MAG: RHS repeat-associated core domain-containing protein [Gemmatimonadota bacterium]